MLKLEDVGPEIAPVVLCDGYFPIRINWGNRDGSVCRYWRAGNQKTKLLELGVCIDTGLLKRICVPLIESPLIEKHIDWPDVRRKAGLPIFSDSTFPASSRHSDSGVNFVPYIGSHHVVLSFKQEFDLAAFIVSSPGAEFAFDGSNQLMVIRIDVSDAVRRKMLEWWA